MDPFGRRQASRHDQRTRTGAQPRLGRPGREDVIYGRPDQHLPATVERGRNSPMIAAFQTVDGIVVPAVTARQMRELDQVAVEETGPNLFQMMENAGRSLAETAIEMLGARSQLSRILVLAGKGGNGGGGICAARHLANRGIHVALCMAEPLALSETTKWQYRVFSATAGRTISADHVGGASFDLIIDSLIGYSLAGAPSGIYAELIIWANATGARLLALDIPSGLDSTVGTADGPVIRADVTMTLALPKTGLASGKAGNLLLADIGIPVETYWRLNLSYLSPFASHYVVPTPPPERSRAMTEESIRLMQAEDRRTPWRLWGPYLSERQWGTVREDYSAGGTAWDYLPHDHARSRAYRWGEDGIAGFCDDQQRLCLSLALWNGHDPILKERLFGLTNSEANHGEDVKEMYYYLDATPTHSYLKMLYKYPQQRFPYEWLVQENRRRGKHDAEFELIDTGVFNDDRYFDVFVEYAKAAPEDILVQITACNRGPEDSTIHVLPQLWFRNTWGWGYAAQRPILRAKSDNRIAIEHDALGEYTLAADGTPSLLFCENETNARRLWGQNQANGYYKDAFHDYLVSGSTTAVNPDRAGTKAAAHYAVTVPPRQHAVFRLRLTRGSEEFPFARFDDVLQKRRDEADAFYAELQSGLRDEDARRVQRQALAGMIWSKQFFYYEVPQWLKGDPAHPEPPADRRYGRNHEWAHLNNADVISMPDKWEYPWYAAWDLAFHGLARPHRLGIRQAATGPDHAGMVHAP